LDLLADHLARETREAELWKPLDRDRVECYACGHRCPISPGFAGVCKVRFNRGGRLYAPYGYVNTACCDPIEKKPFFHALPGSRAFSFGMLGCDLHCGYCQNWVTSQALRDPSSGLDFTAATPAGLVTGFVSNGNATPEVLDYLRPWVDLYKVDLKSFNDRNYRDLGGRLEPILQSIRRIHELGFWLEVVTLIVPGFNDSFEELRQMAEFLAGVSPDIPWHVTAFHKNYKMMGPENTPPETLIRAAGIGRAAGLRYVYAGNLPGWTENLEDTRCPGCGESLIERRGFRVLRNRLSSAGGCPACGRAIPGHWKATP
jgi:pyruvate formate lyase activating enzyme